MTPRPAQYRGAHEFSTAAHSRQAAPHHHRHRSILAWTTPWPFSLALRSPELKVEAITPVSGNVPLALTLPNALRLIEIAGHPEIPVAAGAAVPLVRHLVTASYVHGNNGLGGVDPPNQK